MLYTQKRTLCEVFSELNVVVNLTFSYHVICQRHNIILCNKYNQIHSDIIAKPIPPKKAVNCTTLPNRSKCDPNQLFAQLSKLVPDKTRSRKLLCDLWDIPASIHDQLPHEMFGGTRDKRTNDETYK